MPEEMQHVQPNCPACGKALVYGSREQGTATGLLLVYTWCALCGHLLSMQVIGKAQPIIAPHLDAKKLVHM